MARFEAAGVALATLPEEAHAPTPADAALAVATVRRSLGLPAPTPGDETPEGAALRESVQVLVAGVLALGLSRGEVEAATRAMCAAPELADQLYRYRRPLLASDWTRFARPAEGATGAAAVVPGRLYTHAEALDVLHRAGQGATLGSLFEVVPPAEDGGRALFRRRV